MRELPIDNDLVVCRIGYPSLIDGVKVVRVSHSDALSRAGLIKAGCCDARADVLCTVVCHGVMLGLVACLLKRRVDDLA